jgi:hypothetical protein
MKIASVLILVIAASLLSSCSLVGRWGIGNPSMKLVESRREVLGTKEFVTNRYLVNPQTGETFVETLEVLPSGRPMSYASVGAGAPQMIGRVDVIGPQRF